MVKILFICHGNICRSPMAEMILKKMIKEAHAESKVYVRSAATSREELGNDVYPPARRKLEQQGIFCEQRRAVQVTRKDYEAYDLLIVMDQRNLSELRRIVGGDPKDKIRLLSEYSGRKGAEIADPWYTGDFDLAYEEIREGCEGLMRRLQA